MKNIGNCSLCGGTLVGDQKCTCQPSVAAGYERRLQKADRDIQQLRALYEEWQGSKDDGLVSAIFTRAVSAINAATSS